MDFDKPRRGAHVLVLSYPAQGHINPMLQFSKRLASKGLSVTFITTSSISNGKLSTKNTTSSLEFLCIFDGFNSQPQKDIEYDEYINRLKTSTSKSLHGLLDHYMSQNTTPVPKVAIYDAFMPWILDVVKEFGVEGAPFFTQSCLVNSIYYHFYRDALRFPANKNDLFSLPSVESLLKVDDLPTFISSPSLYPYRMVRLLLDQFSNLNEASCLFVNSIDMLEFKVVNNMTKNWPIKNIGPCIPSMYLDKRLPNDKEYGISLYEPQRDTCLEWLDTKEPSSVVYVSMGSMASLKTQQMEEIAKALENCHKYFLWVVRATEEDKLPTNFKHNKLKKGLIVNWCPQLEVLAHTAIGCFVTHCGWNSTLEAISLGVPLVAFPQWSDQPTNAKCSVDFWKIGVRVRVDENGFLSAKELEFCIREVMEGQRAKEFRNNASKSKQISIQAMEEGGTSNSNIHDFVSKLM